MTQSVNLPINSYELRRIQLRSKRLVTGDLLGQYRSAFRGSGLIFSDLREYSPGDDIRQIHWKATARSGKVYVKSYHEDRQLRVVLAVDTSPSMHAAIGAQSLERALEFSSLIGALTQRGNDQLGLLLFSSEAGTFLPPKAGQRRFARIAGELLKSQSFNVTEGQTTESDLKGALDYLSVNLNKSSIIFVLSDFECKDFSAPLAKLSARHDVVLVQIQPFLRSLPSLGIVTFRDAESGELCVVDTSSKAVQKAWTGVLERAQVKTSSLARGCGVEHIVVSDSCVEPLIKLMTERAKRFPHSKG
jgi:uncharacterized protein (DUF58 family)